jgi:pimeloyl-ACP methyl ester carboxylesterase
MKKYPIIILHGWNLDGEKFRPLVQVLEKCNFRTYAPDLPGFGSRRQLRNSYTLENYVNFLEDFNLKNKLNKIILIGHSFGGRVAIKYSAIHPENIKLLVLTGVPGYVPVKKIKIVVFYLLSKIGKFIFNFPIICNYSTFFRNLLYRVARASDYNNSQGFLRETFINVIRENLETPMKNIRVPTILIWGENDKTVPVFIAEKMHKTIEKSKLKIIKYENHKVPYKSPKHFFDSFCEFMN